MPRAVLVQPECPTNAQCKQLTATSTSHALLTGIKTNVTVRYDQSDHNDSDNIFHLDVHYVCYTMLVRRFEPQGRRFTSSHHHHHHHHHHIIIIITSSSSSHHHHQLIIFLKKKKKVIVIIMMTVILIMVIIMTKTNIKT